MTMSKAQDISLYRFSNADKLLFDTNIWLYIYGIQGNPADYKTRTYSRALSDAVLAHSQIVVDVLVISEFINRYAHLEHQTLYRTGQAPQDFKLFRKSPAFKPIAVAIGSAVRKILRLSARYESDFTAVNIDALLTEFEGGDQDFNDQILARLCQSQGLKLVTHDVDYKVKDINILTVNRQILI